MMTLYHYEEIDSTNEEAKRLAEKGAGDRTLVTADLQTKGKGRKGRSWLTPAGKDIAMSYLLKPAIPADKASMLTLVMALACEKTLRTVSGLDIGVKWPNDIVCNGKKLTGILTEMVPDGERIKYLVIGTGINVNTEEFPDDLKDTATSLKIETGRDYVRDEIIERCAGLFEKYYDTFLRTGDLSGLKDDYNRVCVNNGRRVRVLDPKGEYEGESRGINALGNLIVIKNDGSTEEVYAGEVSVRGIYGYV